MKTLLLTFLALMALGRSEKSRPRRGYSTDFSRFGGFQMHGAHLPLQQTDLYSQGIENYLPIQNSQTSHANYDFKISLPLQQAHALPIPIAASNSVEKPVEEPQEYVPPQSIGQAILPEVPPPATPVNAAASNVQAPRGAVFLGSGSLGVVDLGNGQYALGSGSIGYSENRRQPRPSLQVPLYPPLTATPNLVPAAVPSVQAPPQDVQFPVFPTTIGSPIIGKRPINSNGYEFLPPNEVSFGFRNPRPFRLKTTQAFATPTLEVPQPQPPPLQQRPFSVGPIPFVGQPPVQQQPAPLTPQPLQQQIPQQRLPFSTPNFDFPINAGY